MVSRYNKYEAGLLPQYKRVVVRLYMDIECINLYYLIYYSHNLNML